MKSIAQTPLRIALVALLALSTFIFPTDAAFWARIHGANLSHGALVDEDRSGLAVIRPGRDAASVNYGGKVTPDTYLLYVEGHSQSRVPFLPIHGLLGAIGPLVHPDPRSILIIGQGSGGTPYASGLSPETRRIKIVEIVAPVLTIMREFDREVPDTSIEPFLQDPRFEPEVADARHYLLINPQGFDVIEADAIYPRTSHSGMLYSVEYFRQLRSRLNEGGICVQWAPTERTITSFVQVFPYVLQVNDILLGSDRPIPFSLENIAKRLRNARGYLAAGGWDVNQMIASLKQAPIKTWNPSDPRDDSDVNTDLFPKDEFYLNSKKVDLFK